MLSESAKDCPCECCQTLSHSCDVLNGFQNKMQTINNDLINGCKKTCYSIGGRHDRSATYIP